MEIYRAAVSPHKLAKYFMSSVERRAYFLKQDLLYILIQCSFCILERSRVIFVEARCCLRTFVRYRIQFLVNNVETSSQAPRNFLVATLYVVLHVFKALLKMGRMVFGFSLRMYRDKDKDSIAAIAHRTSDLLASRPGTTHNITVLL